LHFQGLLDDPGGAAAEVGTLVHEVVAHWHRNGFDRDAAVARVGDWRQRFPRLASAGRFDEAPAHVAGYCGDPRNQIKPVLLEQSVSLALPPHETDPTGQPVLLQGTLDQVRETPGGLRLFDLKTSRTEGAQMLDIYAYQVAAYCVMAGELLGEPVASGALIRSAGYLAGGVVAAEQPPGVFFWVPWGLGGLHRPARRRATHRRQCAAGRGQFRPRRPLPERLPRQGVTGVPARSRTEYRKKLDYKQSPDRMTNGRQGLSYVKTLSSAQR
jgi:hypothetical protein